MVESPSSDAITYLRQSDHESEPDRVQMQGKTIAEKRDSL